LCQKFAHQKNYLETILGNSQIYLGRYFTCFFFHIEISQTTAPFGFALDTKEKPLMIRGTWRWFGKMFRPKVQELLNFAQFCNSNQFIKPGKIGWTFGTYYKALDKWDFLEAISQFLDLRWEGESAFWGIFVIGFSYCENSFLFIIELYHVHTWTKKIKFLFHKWALSCSNLDQEELNFFFASELYSCSHLNQEN